MESGSLSTPEFTAFSEKVVPFLHITTRIEGRHNEDLFGKMGGRGFPTLMFLDEEGEKLGEPGGRDAASFDQTLGGLMKVNDLEKRIAAKEKGLEDDLFLAKLALGKYNLAEAREMAKKFTKLNKEQKVELAKYMVNLRVQDALESGGRTEEAKAAVGKKLKAIYDDGVYPEGDMAGPFWGYLMEYAEGTKDVELFAAALVEVKRIFGEQEWAQDLIKEKEASLEKMKNGDEPEEEVVEEVVEGQ